MRFIHTADWQIGKPFGSIEDEEVRLTLRRQRIESVDAIAEAARKHGASFVAVAGDLFDSNTPDKSTVSQLCAAVGQIPVPVLVIPGNHDDGGPGSIYSRSFFQEQQKRHAPNMNILMEPAPFEIDDAVILPAPCLFGSKQANPLRWLSGQGIWDGLSSRKPRIILAHGSVTGFNESEFSSEHVIDLDIVDFDRVDFVALGDWHGTKKISDKCWYSGTHEPDRFPRGEGYSAGNVLLVEVERGGTPSVTPIETGRFFWHRLALHVGDKADVELLQGLISRCTSNRVGRDLVRLELTGTVSLSVGAYLEKVLETIGSELLYLRLRNKLQIIPDDEELQKLIHGSDPLIGRVAKRLTEQLAMPEQEDEREVSEALRLLYHACYGGGNTCA
ncbi:MAG: DNA repair exonuclease [Thermodesulfobacteria bacterium]|nr:DNA repair exonuclease [Thermodesulfobacteriota bacterium]